MKFQPLGNEPVPLNSDPWLAPFREKLRERSRRAVATVKRLTGGKSTLAEFASGHEYFGLHFRDGPTPCALRCSAIFRIGASCRSIG